MREADRLADLVERVVEGDPWYGSNVMELLAGVSAADAARRPSPDTHSIWALVRHMTGWCDEVRARLGGAPAGDPPDGDWPAVDDVSAGAWVAATSRLVDAHRQLAAAIRGVPDDALESPVLDTRDSASGIGLSRYLTLHGLVHHTTYHAGQIAVIRRVLGV